MLQRLFAERTEAFRLKAIAELRMAAYTEAAILR